MGQYSTRQKTQFDNQAWKCSECKDVFSPTDENPDWEYKGGFEWDAVCEECFYERNCSICQICEDSYVNSLNGIIDSLFILMEDRNEHSAGVYKVTSVPFYGQDALGSWINKHAVIRVSDLPEISMTDHYSAFFPCEGCLKKTGLSKYQSPSYPFWGIANIICCKTYGVEESEKINVAKWLKSCKHSGDTQYEDHWFLADIYKKEMLK
ncbi:hypothetical protein N9137_02100 [Pseudomonadales bacterium]|nr:hypothetical protein [Pseudomonadales bacterium]